MRALYDIVSHRASKLVTRAYSTSFSMAISFLDKPLRQPIYDIYGFVRLADEIVDTFHDQDKHYQSAKFRQETYEAIEAGFSLNPILQSFQLTVNKFNIDRELIDLFLDSMDMDLNPVQYDDAKYEKYILGSAEVVGLMCLKVFCYGDESEYQRLYAPARKLGAAFQKVNFLRDINADYEQLGRTYFPGVSFSAFTETQKKAIEEDIAQDFKDGYQGIMGLPKGARFGVYVAYAYYKCLLGKIRRTPSCRILQERIRVSNSKKYSIFLTALIRNELGML